MRSKRKEWEGLSQAVCPLRRVHDTWLSLPYPLWKFILPIALGCWL